MLFPVLFYEWNTSINGSSPFFWVFFFSNNFLEKGFPFWWEVHQLRWEGGLKKTRNGGFPHYGKPWYVYDLTSVSHFDPNFTFWFMDMLFIIIWEWWLISIKVLSCVPIQMKQTNNSIFWPMFGLTVSFADPLWLAISRNQGS